MTVETTIAAVGYGTENGKRGGLFKRNDSVAAAIPWCLKTTIFVPSVDPRPFPFVSIVEQEFATTKIFAILVEGPSQRKSFWMDSQV